MMLGRGRCDQTNSRPRRYRSIARENRAGGDHSLPKGKFGRHGYTFDYGQSQMRTQSRSLELRELVAQSRSGGPPRLFVPVRVVKAREPVEVAPQSQGENFEFRNRFLMKGTGENQGKGSERACSADLVIHRGGDDAM